MKKFLSMVCLLALFSGCNEGANAAQCPTWQTQTERRGNLIYKYLILQSNDDIVIKNMLINRGNCAYAKKYYDNIGYQRDLKTACSEEQKKEFEALNNFNKKELSKSNEYFHLGQAIFTYGKDDKKTEQEIKFEKLKDEFKGGYLTNDYLIGKTFKFGETIKFWIDCDVLEVRLETDKGVCVMPRNR